ncbi:MAG: 2-oxoacid:acceptor oxidoreductase family protein [Propionibacteriaceae bacterium]|jgi:pyruvate-ferredoxin/flavodoxin oxidoreductase|nr:2-oxoacid:acceptor oxidoreductase family protein [Propionibacteriaceae bacterium]
MSAAYPGIPDVINGNGAVAHVMRHVCGGVIGYPITPSTEISETFEAFRAEGQLNVWGKHPFFVEAEGEHSAQSGALGAALTGGNFISNASSSQGILYGLESHYVTVGKKVGGFVLQVAARVVSKHALNVMAGHDDVYSLLPAGYTILFGSNPQEAADLAAISYRVASLSLVPVANVMDGFATSHVMSEVLLPESELLRDYLGDPAGRIPCPTLAQELLFGAKGRKFALEQFVRQHRGEIDPPQLDALYGWLETHDVEDPATSIADTVRYLPEHLQGKWQRVAANAFAKGTRQLVPAYMDPHNPGVTGPVQNQPDFQAGSADHRTHFAAAVPGFITQAMAEYGELTGRSYQPVMRYGDADAELVIVGLGSITDDLRAVMPHLQARGLKVAVVSVKQLQPFPQAEFTAALRGAKAVTIMERSEDNALTRLATQALYHEGVFVPLSTAIFGLGGHDVQPRDLVAVFENTQARAQGGGSELVYVGSQFFSDNPPPTLAALQERLRAAYPETQIMALPTAENPQLLPESAIRIRFHSVGGYGTIATGKLLTDILSGVLQMHSKSSPKYGSEKSGAATNYYITLSPEPVLLTNAEMEDVEVVVAPDHMVFHHSNPLKGLRPGGTFILQSNQTPLEVWHSLPPFARRIIRERQIKFLIVDAFAVAKVHAPTADLTTRMMGIAFIGAIIGHVDKVKTHAGGEVDELVRHEIVKKFGRKGEAVVESNLAVIGDGQAATSVLEYWLPEYEAIENQPIEVEARTVALSKSVSPKVGEPTVSGLFDPEYFEDVAGRAFRDGTIAEAPVLPGAGLFIPAGTGAGKDKGIFRRTVPIFNADACTACMECALVCPDAAIPNTVHEIETALGADHAQYADEIRKLLLADTKKTFAAALGEVGLAEAPIASFPLARTRPIFDVPEKETPGSGALYSVVVDPWKCTGCLQCVEVCGPHALTAVEQDYEVLDELAARFEQFTLLPNTPRRFTESAIKPGGDLKRVLLDHEHYYALTGGHGACRGCGEVTATRLVTALSHAIGDERQRQHIAELEDLIAKLGDTAPDVTAVLEQRLYLYESGPSGHGPSSTAIVNSTGCSSVYASTMPFQPFTDPWVNSLFQDAQAVAVGVFEGFVAGILDEVKAIRKAKAILAGEPIDENRLALLGWRDFTDEELALVPTIFTIGGDGATYDIGFGALSRVLAGGTPVKALVLDTGVYSNTGGQASTASYTGQDADLSRFGKAHGGKKETRKELGLIASFHPRVFSCATATALHSHYLETVMSLLSYTEGAGLMVTYTACGTENGVAEDLSNARAQLAVDSRLSPVFIHDPRRGETLPERFSLAGNPEVDKLWSTTTIEYVDESGALQLLKTPLTPAHFALGEGRFVKQFKPLAPDADGLPIEEYVELPDAQRAGKTPFVYATDRARKLVKYACGPGIVSLVEDRRHYWRTLQFLAGFPIDDLNGQLAALQVELQGRYEAVKQGHEDAMDEIAAAMVELVSAGPQPNQPLPATEVDDLVSAMVELTSSSSPLSGFAFGQAAAEAPTAGKPSASAGEDITKLISLAVADEPKCVDCGTCYQELPGLFEKATIIVDGETKTVGHMITGAKVQITPDLKRKINKVKASCDAEIIK